MKNFATFLLVLLLAGAAWHMIHCYPLLPDTVASHFGGSGQPDGWSSKQSFITVYAVTVAVLGGIFLAIAFAIPKLPKTWVNVPNRDYWLAPERGSESLAAITATLLWLGNATLAFTIAVMHLTFLVNLGQRPGLGSIFFWLLGVYLAGAIGTAVWMAVRFKKAP